MNVAVKSDTSKSNTGSSTNENSPFSANLKKWRKFRKYSQLDLSLEAGISQRHLSFLESGRSRPGKDTILELAEALKMPLRDRNQLLNSAGFASVYQERDLDDATMVTIHNAVKMMLDHHNPFPALAVDRKWNLYMANRASNKLLEVIGSPPPSLLDNGKLNVYRTTFSEHGFRPFLSNWDKIANPLLLRLQREVNDDPCNEYLSNLLDEMQAMHGTDNYSAEDIAATVAPVLGLELKFGDVELKMFSMISAFGTALDVTASEIKVETFFPANEFTRQFFASK